jgi:hypothetical protein
MFGNQFATFPLILFMGTVKFVIDHGTFEKDLLSYDDQDHTKRNCKWPANNRVKSEVWNHPLITGD